MKIHEYIDKYCPEMREYAAACREYSELEELPHDGVSLDESGERVPYVLCNGDEIPIMDIITSTEEDFARQYPDMECRMLYKSYIDALTILDGEEALMHIRNSIRREQERVKAFSEQNDLADSLW